MHVLLYTVRVERNMYTEFHVMVNVREVTEVCICWENNSDGRPMRD